MGSSAISLSMYRNCSSSTPSIGYSNRCHLSSLNCMIFFARDFFYICDFAARIAHRGEHFMHTYNSDAPHGRFILLNARFEMPLGYLYTMLAAFQERTRLSYQCTGDRELCSRLALRVILRVLCRYESTASPPFFVVLSGRCPSCVSISLLFLKNL